MEYLVLGLFAASLFLCLVSGQSVLYALLFGYLLFNFYGLHQKHTPREMLSMTWNGVRTARNVLMIFFLVGMLTALWRASGTIALIITWSLKVVRPDLFILISFLICCLISFLTGTSLGTAATVGVICMTMGNGMGCPPILMGGAILSGAYFGDRCSPLSTSALLTSEVTRTDIYRNIKNMVRTSVGPFVITCILYLAAGYLVPALSGNAAQAGNLASSSAGSLASNLAGSSVSGLAGAQANAGASMSTLFAAHYRLHPVAVIPALVILVLSLLRFQVKITMSVSILTAFFLAWLLQGESPAALVQAMLFGYRVADPDLARLIDGGGILSMAKVFAIVCISSSYAGIFNGTGLLNGLKESLSRMGRRISPFGSMLVTSVLTCMIACNQTLSTILTSQLCEDMYPDRDKLAVDLENSVIVIAALIPWSIACTMPLTTINAPVPAFLAACYLYLLPLWNFVFWKPDRI